MVSGHSMMLPDLRRSEMTIMINFSQADGLFGDNLVIERLQTPRHAVFVSSIARY